MWTMSSTTERGTRAAVPGMTVSRTRNRTRASTRTRRRAPSAWERAGSSRRRRRRRREGRRAAAVAAGGQRRRGCHPSKRASSTCTNTAYRGPCGRGSTATTRVTTESTRWPRNRRSLYRASSAAGTALDVGAGATAAAAAILVTGRRAARSAPARAPPVAPAVRVRTTSTYRHPALRPSSPTGRRCRWMRTSTAMATKRWPTTGILSTWGSTKRLITYTT